MLRRNTSRCLSVLLILSFASLPSLAQASRDRGEQDTGPILTERERAAHVLNRMAFGPRPGDVDRVMQMGVENWMRQQLDPDSINNEFVETYIRDTYPSLGMTSGDIYRTYRPPYTPYQNDPPTAAERQLRQRENDERNRMQGQVQRQLRDSVYYRALNSERQFEEVIVAFWREHFSIDQGKDDVSYLANNWEEQVIRRFAFGSFEHLLLASSRHPAMLIYLDNIVSQRPLTEREEALVERFEQRENIPNSVRALSRQRGLNENYARELMELHTLGVDREYSQRDVTEMARVLTGWTARWGEGVRHVPEGQEPNGQLAEYGFYFNREYHDPHDKTVLGTRLRGGGEEQGIRVIRALANHRMTADFISRKLCAYLLRDEPSEMLVDEVSRVFLRTDGDLPSVYEAIIFSDEFFYRQNHRVKFKTPFEFVISAMRATDAEAYQFSGIDGALRLMGQPTYRCPDPTGWYDTAEAWLDPGVLVYRWTFALDLANNRIDGVRIPESLTANAPGQQLRTRLEDTIVPAGLSDRTRQIIDEEMGPNPNATQLLGILLGSPDFQQQ